MRLISRECFESLLSNDVSSFDVTHIWEEFNQYLVSLNLDKSLIDKFKNATVKDLYNELVVDRKWRDILLIHFNQYIYKLKVKTNLEMLHSNHDIYKNART